MYVIQYRCEPTTGRTYSRMLTEMTVAKYLKAEHNERCYYERVAASYAHRWVLNGGHHDTPLYVEQGRIRRASE